MKNQKCTHLNYICEFIYCGIERTNNINKYSESDVLHRRHGDNIPEEENL